MILLDLRFFHFTDVYLVPFCILILYAILRNRANNCKDPAIRKIYYKGFAYKVFFVFAFTLIAEFYFKGGDTGLYFQAVKDLRTALKDNIGYLHDIAVTNELTPTNPLSWYFQSDNYADDYTYGYMVNISNFFMPRLALVPALIFFDSYLCIALCFGFVALGGMIRLLKMFYHFYPASKKELALSIIFLPSLVYWSSGLLKDSICLGCVGFLLYAVFSIFKRKQKIVSSAIIVIISSYLLITIKAYIFLVLILAIIVWLFAETSRVIKEKGLRQLFTVFTFGVSIIAGFFIVRYITAQEALQQYQLDNISNAAELQRNNYRNFDNTTGGTSSYYAIGTSNPALLVVNSFAATFYRPFLWEVTSATAVLAAFEAVVFLFLTIYLFFKRGIVKPFSTFFSDPIMLLCFVFSIVFAIGVGISTANFGTLSRYKIPCLPFYLIMLLISYRTLKLEYPKWFSKLLSYIKI